MPHTVRCQLYLKMNFIQYWCQPVMNTAWSVAKAEIVFKSCNPTPGSGPSHIRGTNLAWRNPGLHSKIKKGKSNGCKKTAREKRSSCWPRQMLTTNSKKQYFLTDQNWETKNSQADAIQELNSCPPRFTTGFRQVQGCSHKWWCKSFKNLHLSPCCLHMWWADPGQTLGTHQSHSITPLPSWTGEKI